MTLMARLSLTLVVAIVAMAAIVWEALSTTHGLLNDDRQIKTRHLVEVAYSVAEGYYAQQKNGTLSEEAARELAIRAIKGLRYEKTDYFWINDLGKPVPKMIMHPTVPKLDGALLDDPKFNKATSIRADVDGKPEKVDQLNLFVAINRAVEKTGQGYVEYMWPKPQAGGGVSEETFLKLSFVKKFEPWGWVIGSGIYVDDVQRIFREHATRLLALALIGTLLFMLVSWLVARSLFGEVGGEPRIAVSIAGKIAEGDLTREIRTRPNDRDSLLFVLKHMQDKLREMLSAVSDNARVLERSIQRLSAESNEIIFATQLQAAAIDQTRGAISDISSSVDVVNRLASETQDGAVEVNRRALAGAAIAVGVAAEMENIAATVANSSSEVARLAASTQEIDKMANVISGIAGQTNLLALNAAIEAARAGEQGRGFAVVADEVRKLAERTSLATQEIGVVLKGIQKDTERAVAGMDTAAPIIANGVAQARVAAETLNSIEKQSLDTLHKMQQLSDATREQTKRIDQIIGSVDEVMSTSQRTETVIKQSSKSASELDSAANRMFAMVKRFNIGDAGADDDDSDGSRVRPLLEWSPAISVGHGEIDRQHQILIEIANRLNAAMQSGKGRAATGAVLKELVDYTVEHFAFEERLMEKHAYGERTRHIEQHRRLVDDVLKFKREFDNGTTAVSVDLMNFIRDWLVNHILKVDRAFAGDLAKRGIS
jgi:methyl-accepting chemotaxis protein